MRQIKLIIIIGLFHQLVIQGSRPIVALLANDLGANKLEIGLIAATFAFFPLILAVKAGSWIDKWGYFKPIVMGSIGISLAIFLPFIYPSIFMLYLSQVFAGISQVFVNISLQSALGLSVKKEKRDKVFGWFNFAVSGGQFLGPLLIGFSSDQLGLVNAFLIGTLFSFIPIIVGLFLFNKQTKPKTTAKPKSTKIKDETITKPKISSFQIVQIKGMHQVMLASMLVQFTKDVMMTYFPLYATDKGISDTEIGLILGVQGLASMFIRILQGTLMKRFSRKMVILVSLLIAGITFGIFTSYHHVTYFSVIAIVMGLGLGLAQPLSQVMVVNLSPEGQSGQALGLRIAGNRFAQVISPIMFGAIAQVAGITPIFWICGGILIVGSIYSTWNMSE